MSLLGVDLGTTGCKAETFSEDGRRLAQAYREYSTRQSGDGRAELDSKEVWQKVCEVISDVAGRTIGDPIEALSTSSIGEAVVPVTKERELLGPTILCTDPRGSEYSDALISEIGQDAFYRINPNILGPQYSLPKILWLRDNEPGIYEKADYFLLWGDLIGFLLGCDPVACNSLANRTLLFDLSKNDWSEKLLKWSRIDRSRLGRIEAGGKVIGTVSDAMAKKLGLPKGVKVVTGGHDQCCNALGSGCVDAGMAVCGIGTFECITPTYSAVPDPKKLLAEGLNVEHHVLPGLYVSFLFNQGCALTKWFRDTFAAGEVSQGKDDIYALLNKEMPSGPTSLLTLPHFVQPMWPRLITETSGVIAGLTTSTTRGEILKSIMECETFYFVDSLRALSDLGIDTREFIATGGGAKSDAWLQIKADIFGVPFVRPKFSEGSLLGAAMLAGLAVGKFRSASDAAAVFVKQDKRFEPDAARHQLYREKCALYNELYPAMAGVLKKIGRPSA